MVVGIDTVKFAYVYDFILPLHLQATSYVFLALPSRIASSAEVQIKNIKLHIVTDIKVGISSIFDFRISLFGWGAGHLYLPKKCL